MPEITVVGSGFPEVVFCDRDGLVVDVEQFRGDDYASGFDLVVSEDTELSSEYSVIAHTGLFIKEVTVVDTGKRLLIPDMQVRPRSGMSLKTGLDIRNAPGTIDISYPGEIGVIVRCWDAQSTGIVAGTRSAQLVIGLAVIPYPKGGKLRFGGFGSTGE